MRRKEIEEAIICDMSDSAAKNCRSEANDGLENKSIKTKNQQNKDFDQMPTSLKKLLEI